jgi:hypothetical protein
MHRNMHTYTQRTYNGSHQLLDRSDLAPLSKLTSVLLVPADRRLLRWPSVESLASLGTTAAGGGSGGGGDESDAVAQALLPSPPGLLRAASADVRAPLVAAVPVSPTSPTGTSASSSRGMTAAAAPPRPAPSVRQPSAPAGLASTAGPPATPPTAAVFSAAAGTYSNAHLGGHVGLAPAPYVPCAYMCGGRGGVYVCVCDCVCICAPCLWWCAEEERTHGRCVGRFFGGRPALGVRIGVLGTGWATKVQVPAFRHAGLAVTAVWARTEAKAAAAAAALHIPFGTHTCTAWCSLIGWT